MVHYALDSAAVVLDQLEALVVLAPMAGGPATPRLVASVSEAGGLGFLAAGYLSAAQTARAVAVTRDLTERPFGVNVFAASAGPTDPRVYASYVKRLTEWAGEHGAELGSPRWDDDDLEAKVELLISEPVSVVSFTFGCPSPSIVERLHSSGSEAWITVASPGEAAEAAATGADALIVQGTEAGGHRASFVDREDVPLLGLLALLQLIGAEQELDLIAAGGIATGRGLAAVLTAGARAAQVGSAFLLCPEAGTSPAHRGALKAGMETTLTRAFTGRLARGIRNAFITEHEAAAPIAYPEIHHLTAPLRKAARERGDASAVNMWAGQTHQLAREIAAGEVVRALAGDARAAITTTAARLRTATDA